MYNQWSRKRVDEGAPPLWWPSSHLNWKCGLKPFSLQPVGMTHHSLDSVLLNHKLFKFTSYRPKKCYKLLAHGTFRSKHNVEVLKMNIFYSGVLGLWLGVCSPEQPLVPTGVKSPFSVSGGTEAVKRGLHSSIFANQWKHFLSSCPPHALNGVSITAMCVIHSCVSWLLVNAQFDEGFQV